MELSVERSVGQRVRVIREAKGLSLRALAAQSGLSANAISLIERGENSATVGSLHALATALDVPLTEFFRSTTSRTIVVTRRFEGVRTESRGISLASLGSGLPDQQLEPFLMVVGSGKGLAESVSHDGEELVHLLSGAIKYGVGDEEFDLLPGDSLLFKAASPHCFHNCGEVAATLLIVFTSGAAFHLGAGPGQGISQ